MKNLLLLFALCTCFVAFSQDIKRENIDGKIIVEGNDIEGIVVFNSSSNIGTVTDENGEFTIAVASNDLIKIRALEYQNFDVIINEAIIDSKKMSIYLIEEINRLDDVIITYKGLSGNLKADIKNVKTFSPKLDALYFGINNQDAYDFSDDSLSGVENEGIDRQGQSLVNGLNVINIVDQLLIPLFRSEVKDKKTAGVPEVPPKYIKYYLGSSFLVANFNIPEHRVEEFIRYVEDDTFNFDLLNYGNEMQFLELLAVKSDAFLQAKGNKE